MSKITEGLKEQFAKNIELKLRDEVGTIKNTLTIGTQETEICSFESMGAMNALSSRARDAVAGNDMYGTYGQYQNGKFDMTKAADFYGPNVSRRYMSCAAYSWGGTSDRNDDINLIANPTNHYPKIAAFEIARKQEEVIVLAFGKSVKAGRTGDKTINFDVSNNVIPVGVNVAPVAITFNANPVAMSVTIAGVVNNAKVTYAKVVQEDLWNAAAITNPNLEIVKAGQAGLTVEKLIKARSILKRRSLTRSNKFFMLCTQRQIDDLLHSTKITSSDYNNVKALVNGEVDTFLGFKFVVSEQLGGVADHEAVDGRRYAVRDCYAYTEGAIRFNTVKGSVVKAVETLIQYHNNYFMYYSESFGATRDNEEGIVCVKCLEEYNAADHDPLIVGPQWKVTANADYQRSVHAAVVLWQIYGVQCKTVNNVDNIDDPALIQIALKTSK